MEVEVEVEVEGYIFLPCTGWLNKGLITWRRCLEGTALWRTAEKGALDTRDARIGAMSTTYGSTCNLEALWQYCRSSFLIAQGTIHAMQALGLWLPA